MLNPNLNSFLLEIAPAIIRILNDDLKAQPELELIYICGRYYSYDLGRLSILDATSNFASRSSYCDCDHCNENYHEFAQQYYESFTEYTNTILPDIFNNVIKNPTLDPDFIQDYQNTLTALLNQKITLQQAQDALQCWLGVLNDTQLQNELVKLTYKYIENLINGPYSNFIYCLNNPL